MNYASAQNLSAQQFKRRFGITPKTFQAMVCALRTQHPSRPAPGRPPTLSRKDQLLVTRLVLERV